jgi:hypothetical protein
MKEKTYKPTELIFAAMATCSCGAGLAHPLNSDDAMRIRAWVCSAALMGEPHEGFGVCDFAMYKVREETSINNREGLTTRPEGTVAMTVGRARCSACAHEWESKPYSACGLSHHWFCGPCPKCGVEYHHELIDVRYRDVVVPATAEKRHSDTKD